MSPEFEQEHAAWYEFIREKLKKRVDLTFEEATAENSSLVLNQINQALPTDFQGVLYIKS